MNAAVYYVKSNNSDFRVKKCFFLGCSFNVVPHMGNKTFRVAGVCTTHFAHAHIIHMLTFNTFIFYLQIILVVSCHSYFELI